MVAKAINASKQLNQHDIYPSVYNFHTIKPISQKTLNIICKKYKLITIEEHNIIGGLGSAVSEIIVQNESNIKQVFMGVKDNYLISGDYETILNKIGLNEDHIIKEVKNNI